MTLTHVTLTAGADGGAEIGAAVLRDILWAYVRAGDPVEHISARAGPGRRLEVGVFTAPTGAQEASAVARDLVERALRGSRSLSRWALTEVRPSSLPINSGR